MTRNGEHKTAVDAALLAHGSKRATDAIGRKPGEGPDPGKGKGKGPKKVKTPKR